MTDSSRVVRNAAPLGDYLVAAYAGPRYYFRTTGRVSGYLCLPCRDKLEQKMNSLVRSASQDEYGQTCYGCRVRLVKEERPA